MAFTFDATPGGAAANSYSSVEYADDHLGGELYAAEWAALDNAVAAQLLKKQQALVKATRRLERLEYEGDVPNTTQRLKHPRYGLESESGVHFPSTAVAEPLRQACAELALHYLKQDPSALVEDALRQFKHLKVAGVVELEMRERLPDEEELPPHVLALIAPWLASHGAVRLLRA